LQYFFHHQISFLKFVLFFSFIIQKMGRNRVSFGFFAILNIIFNFPHYIFYFVFRKHVQKLCKVNRKKLDNFLCCNKIVFGCCFCYHLFISFSHHLSTEMPRSCMCVCVCVWM
jgi:hypothetical protein